MKASLKATPLVATMAVIGPGLVVMLADTDAGSLITSAQMGAIFGYKMLFQSFILIPILFLAQELTVRLGVVTQKGHGELIKSHFGSFWAWLSVGTLIVSCVGAMITEFIGLVGVGNLYGIPASFMVMASIAFLLLIVLLGHYRFVERVAICLGLFELMFLFIAYRSHPSFGVLAHDMATFPADMHHYLYFTAANIGAVIMPWMIFYQQSAVVDKGLQVEQLKHARWDTLIGAIITQVVMAAILMATAATLHKAHAHTALDSVEQISHSFVAFLGVATGKAIFACAMLGACLVAAIVVTLTAAWGLGEVLGYRRSLSDSFSQAPWFYLCYAVVLVLSGLLVLTPPINLVGMNVAIEVMNALLLPIVLGFLYLLACKTLPEQYRPKGWYRRICLIVLGGSAFVGIGSGLLGFFA